MKRYRFRLAPVLRVREIQEDLALAAFQRARQDRQRADDLLAASVQACSPGSPAGPADASDVRALRLDLERRADAVERAAGLVSSASTLESERRDDLAAALARVRGLENLRERQLADHAREVLRDEDLDNDERSNQRRHRAAVAATAAAATAAAATAAVAAPTQTTNRLTTLARTRRDDSGTSHPIRSESDGHDSSR